MTAEREEVPLQLQETRMQGLGGLIERLSRFDGAPPEFLATLLAAQCQIASVTAGAILRPGAESRAEVLAVHPLQPQAAPAPDWLVQAGQWIPQALAPPGQTAVRAFRGPDELYGQPAHRHVVIIPTGAALGINGAALFLVETDNAQALASAREQLELTTQVLAFYELRHAGQRARLDMERLRVAMETLTAINSHTRFAAAAMALCNEISSRWQCERVGLGFLKGRYVQLRAMSHTEKFSRKMKLVQNLEAAMEECLDQDIEVLHPSEPEAAFVSRAASELSLNHGHTVVLSLPVR